VSVNVPLRKWRSADPAILIGRRCIARTNDDVVIDHDPNTCSNSMGDGIRSLAIYGKE
jgi:hypothetical protein